MLGCESLAAASTSRWNRSTAPACFMAAEERTLMATRRFIRRCWAFSTTPIPPSPIWSSTVYSAKTSPLPLPL